nr:DUF2971 domain-containing protein [uncultured Duganella sp.]
MSEFPAKFYKYRSMNVDTANWVERTVLCDEIYFAAASSFNDPFDLRPSFSLEAPPERQREDFLRMSRKFEPELTEEQRQAEADKVMATSMSIGDISNTVAAIQTIHNHHITTKVGVLCVSTKCDDILMWSHYADSHRGICLEFDGAAPFMAHAQKIQYSDERVPINPYDDDPDVMMQKSLLVKSNHWAYESEWRLLRYVGGPGVVKFRPVNLTGIILGALASTSTIDLVTSWIQRRSAPVNVYRASVSSKKFELVVA